jgi:hypothetical protein
LQLSLSFKAKASLHVDNVFDYSDECVVMSLPLRQINLSKQTPKLCKNVVDGCLEDEDPAAQIRRAKNALQHILDEFYDERYYDQHMNHHVDRNPRCIKASQTGSNCEGRSQPHARSSKIEHKIASRSCKDENLLVGQKQAKPLPHRKTGRDIRPKQPETANALSRPLQASHPSLIDDYASPRQHAIATTSQPDTVILPPSASRSKRAAAPAAIVPDDNEQLRSAVRSLVAQHRSLARGWRSRWSRLRPRRLRCGQRPHPRRKRP